MQWVTLWLHVSTVNSHHQAKKEHFVWGTERYYSVGSHFVYSGI